MSAASRVKSALSSLIPRAKYRLGGTAYQGMPDIAEWGVPDYIRSASDIGWFYRGLYVIAASVSKQEWHLYKCLYKDGQKQRDEIPQHIILDLLASVNPFMTWIDFISLQTMYLVAVGSCYTVLDYNSLSRPEMMWPVRPDRISPIRDRKEDYISAYQYTVGQDKIRLELPEVIAVRHPNLANPLLGSGSAEALKQQLATEYYSNAMRAKLFHNDATPGQTFIFKDVPGPEKQQEIVEKWRERHQGWQNIRKPAFLFGDVSIKDSTMPFKDLDLTNQDKARGRQILQVMGVPPLLAGDTEDLNRATSEAALFVFTSFTVDPILAQFREAWNEQLIPRYPQNENLWLELGYDSPVPRDKAAIQTAADNTLRSAGCTLNEYRQMLDLPPLDEGEVFFVPSNITVVPTDQLAEYVPPAPAPGPFGLSYLGNPGHSKNGGCRHETRETTSKIGEATPARNFKGKIALSEEGKTAHWHAWVDKAATIEARLVKDLRVTFKEQGEDTIARYREGSQAPYDIAQGRRDYAEVLSKHIPKAFTAARSDAHDLVAPEHPKAQEPPPVLPTGLDQDALTWLKTRMAWAAEQVGESLAEDIRQAIQTGFVEGEGMDEIAMRIQSVFDGCQDYRSLRIARTEVMTASNQGAIEGYKDMGITKMEWLAERDARCCDDCYAANGEQLDVGGGEQPPLHVNCRCTIVPVE